MSLIRAFPGLAKSHFEITSDPNALYNCIAWAAGDDQHFWWPGAFWPRSLGKQVTRENFVQAFETRGYAVCAHPDPEVGFEKVALYEDNGIPTHAARQLADGRWTSKLGSFHDIAHSLDALNGDQYGAPVLYMKRALSTESPSAL